MPTPLEETLIEIISRLNALEAELDDVKSQLGETSSVESGQGFPPEPHDNQLFVRADEGVNGGGVMYRFDETINDWVELN